MSKAKLYNEKPVPKQQCLHKDQAFPLTEGNQMCVYFDFEMSPNCPHCVNCVGVGGGGEMGDGY